MKLIIKMTATLIAGGLLATASAAETVSIGVIGMMTGPGAAWGVAGSAGVRYAADEVNANGGLDINGTKYRIDVKVYDDQYKASEAISAYNRLVHDEGVKYLMTMSSASTMALKEKIESDDVLLLTSAYSSKIIDPKTKHIVRLYSTPRDYVPPIVSWMRKHIGGKKVTLLYPNDETGWDFVEFTAKAFNDAGYNISARELYERSQKDFLPILTRIIATKPDIIDLGPTSPATAGLITRQLRGLGFSGQISALGGSGPKEIVAAAGAKAAEGVINMLYADPNNKEFKRLKEVFVKQYGQEPNELIVPYYDATKVLLKAIKLSGVPKNPQTVRAALKNALPMQSLQGETMTFGGMNTIGVDAQIMSVNYIGTIRSGEPFVISPVK
ncbi:ABC transporter substrate-binding protein [Noviherbaspirillum sedimenti]|uniref:Leucine-binding protein domain-containing protein n=1 Tax=Noviherbaspirillum sedimenti TaxID=2320865 RepID=A0A3A3GLX3_9BURK|nr:ABC transporter substrate-binding protein [Noviherbaspirillum sedimenti]RJG03286.1 hypothetical protein D3878_18225 [Noviherbaspirillum sedimenti]